MMILVAEEVADVRGHGWCRSRGLCQSALTLFGVRFRVVRVVVVWSLRACRVMGWVSMLCRAQWVVGTSVLSRPSACVLGARLLCLPFSWRTPLLCTQLVVQ